MNHEWTRLGLPRFTFWVGRSKRGSIPTLLSQGLVTAMYCIIIKMQNSVTFAQDLPFLGKFALVRCAIPYPSRWRRKQRSSSSWLEIDKKFGQIIKKSESLAIKTSTNSSNIQGTGIEWKIFNLSICSGKYKDGIRILWFICGVSDKVNIWWLFWNAHKRFWKSPFFSL